MNSPDFENDDLDYEALQARYAQERVKRLRSDKLEQYQALEGQFSAFGNDPFTAEPASREPVRRDAQVLIVGGGFGGLLAGAHLRQAGVEDVVIVDKAADFGGTWYWNRYPGIRCDIESYVYVPFLEETGFVPSEKYAKGEEIFDQCQRIGRHFGLYDRALFQTEVKHLQWLENRQRWLVQTSRGDEIAARFVICCTGLLSSPKLPGIPGIETFKGHSFHTSRWDFDYSGGREDGRLTGLEGKTVGVIGTGSTGIQVVPPLAQWAEQLYVFQRTPCSVDVRGNRPTDPDWAASLEPGWQQGRVENFTFWTSGVRRDKDLISDSWTNLLGEPTAVAGGATEVVDPEEMQRAEMRKMESVRRRIAATVKDPKTAESLKPYYNYFCKRPGFSDDYLETFNRPNVTLVDTGGKGVERITPKGVVVDGREYELDCLVYATGFDFMTGFTRESGLRIEGRSGQSLDEHWAHGARTLYGMQTRGFPNFFLMSLVQSGISINYMHIADEQTHYMADVISGCIEKGVGSVEPTAEAEQEWVDRIISMNGPRKAFLASCTPSYFNYEGEHREALELNAPFGGGPIEYVDMLGKWRAEGAMAGLELHELANQE